MLNIINSIFYVLCVLIGYFLCYKFSNQKQEEKQKRGRKIVNILKPKLAKKEQKEEKEKEEEFKKVWENLNNYDGFETSQKG